MKQPLFRASLKIISLRCKKLCSILLLSSVAHFSWGEALNVYGLVPGLAQSDQYRFRVRELGTEPWHEAHAFKTFCPIQANEDASTYYEILSGWSHSYINFEMDGSKAIEVEIRKLDGSAITRAAAHPWDKVRSCRLQQDGKVSIIIEEPGLFAVDIDGQMDLQHTGRGYAGDPIHTLSIFANPPITDKPDPEDPGVYVVEPSVTDHSALPDFSEENYHTVYFAPGVHNLWNEDPQPFPGNDLDQTIYNKRFFPLVSGMSYYIPGDAIVHGTLNSGRNWPNGENIRIFGHGTLSGERIDHPLDDPNFLFTPETDTNHSWQYDPIHILGAGNTSVEGITLADSAHHSIKLAYPYTPNEPTDIRWTKIFTWRVNGDGINPFGNTLIADCFIRTQDDSTYVTGRGIRRSVFWNDANGSAFLLNPVGDIDNPADDKVIVEDCDVIYTRSKFFGARGGRVFCMRGEGEGAGGSKVLFRNIRVHDPFPTLQSFYLLSAAPFNGPSEFRGPGALSGIEFRDIQIAALSVDGHPEVIQGTQDAPISSFVFHNVTVAGKPLEEVLTVGTNVSNLIFTEDNPMLELAAQLDTASFAGQGAARALDIDHSSEKTILWNAESPLFIEPGSGTPIYGAFTVTAVAGDDLIGGVNLSLEGNNGARIRLEGLKQDGSLGNIESRALLLWDVGEKSGSPFTVFDSRGGNWLKVQTRAFYNASGNWGSGRVHFVIRENDSYYVSKLFGVEAQEQVGVISGGSTGLQWAEFDPNDFFLFDAIDTNLGFGSLNFQNKIFENVDGVGIIANNTRANAASTQMEFSHFEATLTKRKELLPKNRLHLDVVGSKLALQTDSEGSEPRVRIEYSDDLKNWSELPGLSPLLIRKTGQDATWEFFHDIDTEDAPQRFYRSTTMKFIPREDSDE